MVSFVGFECNIRLNAVNMITQNATELHNVYDFERHASIDLRSSLVANELQRTVTALTLLQQ